MTQREFNDKYRQYLKERSLGLCFNPPRLDDSEVIIVLDQVFSSVLVHIPNFQYEFLFRTVMRNGFTFGSNLPEVAGVFGQKLQDLVEDYCCDASAFYETDED
jgi:hypothetical protein